MSRNSYHLAVPIRLNQCRTKLTAALDHDNTIRSLQGAWLVEIEELGSLKSTRLVERVKSFISTKVDELTPKYSNFKQAFPRRCVFIGTSNPGEFLPGDTGDTRFFPINTPGPGV